MFETYFTTVCIQQLQSKTGSCLFDTAEAH